MPISVLSMGAVVMGYIFYHLAQKFLPANANPFVIAGISYTIAAGIAWIGAFLFTQGSVKSAISLPVIVMGCSVVVLDIGFIWVYRSGWGVSNAPIFANVAVALCVLPIGVLFFNESFSVLKALGFLLCIVGLFLIKG